MEGIAGTLYGVTNRMKEPEVNREATEYIRENYFSLVERAWKSFGAVYDMASDAVHDVYLSYLQSEDNGNGYDESMGRKDDGIPVEFAVYGRLKGYCKNVKYRNGTVHRKGAVVVSASSSELDEESERNVYQQAYAMAQSYDDDLDDVEEGISFREELQYVVTTGKRYGAVQILDNLQSLEQRIDSIDHTLFTQMHEVFADAYPERIRAAKPGKKKDMSGLRFDKVIESIIQDRRLRNCEDRLTKRESQLISDVVDANGMCDIEHVQKKIGMTTEETELVHNIVEHQKKRLDKRAEAQEFVQTMRSVVKFASKHPDIYRETIKTLDFNIG